MRSRSLRALPCSDSRERYSGFRPLIGYHYRHLHNRTRRVERPNPLASSCQVDHRMITLGQPTPCLNAMLIRGPDAFTFGTLCSKRRWV
jgi:ribosomal protein L28